MFEHVLVGVDFSPGGDAVMRSLPGLRTLGTRRLTLVNVLDIVYPSMAVVEHLEAYRARLREQVTHLEAEGFEVGAELRVGDPAREICAAAARLGASLILVGSRSHSRVADAFLGSVAWGVVHRSEVPVLVQRVERAGGNLTEPGPLEAVGAYERVVFPTDWSPEAVRAEAYVEALASLGGVSSFVILHVRSQLEETRTGTPTEVESLARLEEIASRLRAAGAEDVQVDAPSGAPFAEIIRHASMRPKTLIVIGTHGRGLIGDAFLGSVSREVVRKSYTPVLLVPAER